MQHGPNSYPCARYHGPTGQMRVVMSPEEETALGSDWGEAITDIRYPKNPVPIREEPRVVPVFSVKLPGAR